MKKIITTLCLLVSMVFVANDSTYAAENHKLNKAQETEIAQGLADLGVNEATQKNLMKKLEHGEKWDSMNQEKIDAVKDQLKVTPERPYVKYVFEDGSVISTSLVVPQESQYHSLDGGTRTCGTGYCSYMGVRVYRDDGIVKAFFYADYTNLNGASDRIDNIYSWNITVRGGNFSNQSLNYINPVEMSSSYAAQAELFFNWGIVGGIANGVNRLDLFVGQDTAWQSASY